MLAIHRGHVLDLPAGDGEEHGAGAGPALEIGDGEVTRLGGRRAASPHGGSQTSSSAIPPAKRRSWRPPGRGSGRAGTAARPDRAADTARAGRRHRRHRCDCPARRERSPVRAEVSVGAAEQIARRVRRRDGHFVGTNRASRSYPLRITRSSTRSGGDGVAPPPDENESGRRRGRQPHRTSLAVDPPCADPPVSDAVTVPEPVVTSRRRCSTEKLADSVSGFGRIADEARSRGPSGVPPQKREPGLSAAISWTESALTCAAGRRREPLLRSDPTARPSTRICPPFSPCTTLGIRRVNRNRMAVPASCSMRSTMKPEVAPEVVPRGRIGEQRETGVAGGPG